MWPKVGGVFVGVATALALTVAGCSSGSDDSGGGQVTDVPAPSGSVTPSSSLTAPGTSVPSGTSDPGAAPGGTAGSVGAPTATDSGAGTPGTAGTGAGTAGTGGSAMPPATDTGAAGAGAAGMPGDMVDPGGPIMTSGDPVIPQVTGDCPSFQSGSFSFQGLSGEMEVGPMGSGGGPLVFYWHGTGGSAGGFRSPFGGIGSGNIQKITSQGGIIFAVQGATGSGDASCSGTAVFDGDFSVIDQVVACAVRDHNIDPRRIYATGCSAGGLQSGCMAARRQGYVAAVAPNSGGVVFPMPFDGAIPVPASMTMHGGTGDNVGINFGDSSRTFNDAVTAAGGFAVDCNHMSGHCGAPGDLYDAAIDFLLAHPYGVEPEPYASGLPAGVPSYCEIY